MSEQTIFNAAYIASKDPRIQALFTMNNTNPPGGRDKAAYALALGGLIIDAVIDGDGQDPFNIMSDREQDGYLWTESALMTVTDTSLEEKLPIPPGGIKVSTYLADYPPYGGYPPPPPPTDSVVGNSLGCTSDQISPSVLPAMQVFTSNANQHYPEGKIHTMTSAGGSGLLKAGDKVSYHLMGDPLMDNQQRLGVWLGPVVS